MIAKLLESDIERVEEEIAQACMTIKLLNMLPVKDLSDDEIEQVTRWQERANGEREEREKYLGQLRQIEEFIGVYGERWVASVLLGFVAGFAALLAALVKAWS